MVIKKNSIEAALFEKNLLVIFYLKHLYLIKKKMFSS